MSTTDKTEEVIPVSPYQSRIHTRAPGPFAGSSLPPREDVWVVLERFAGDVNRCDKSCRHQLALEAVRDSIAAEAVFWYPGSSDDAVAIAGDCDLPTAWCSSFAKKLI